MIGQTCQRVALAGFAGLVVGRVVPVLTNCFGLTPSAHATTGQAQVDILLR